MTIDRMVEQVFSGHPEIQKEKVVARLLEERKRTNGLISDEILLRMIAAEFGVDAQGENVSFRAISGKDLVPGLGNVTVVGRIAAVFQPKAFHGRRSGEFASLLLVDEHGILRVVLWNDKTDLVRSGKVSAGQIIRVCHGYTKQGRSEKVELHVGDRCDIEINPENVPSKDYPTISKFTKKTSEVTGADRNKRVNVAGTVRRMFPSSSFERQDSSIGKVMRFLLSDERGELSVVAWNEKVDELEGSLHEGVELQMIDAKVKKTGTGELEVHVDAGTYVELLSAARFTRISDLREGVVKVNVEGEVVTKPVLREIRTARKELVKVASFELRDETERVWVSAWRQQADTVAVLQIGDRIEIENAYVRKGFGEQLEVSTREATSIRTSR